MKPGQNVLNESRTSSKMGYVGSKTRSIGHIVEKACVRSRDQIFWSDTHKTCQSLCLDEISYIFENRSCLVKN